MGKIVITENVSLDGVIEDPTGAEGLSVGGWFWETDRGEDGEQFTLDKTLRTEALLLGRRSYEFFAATWPSRPSTSCPRRSRIPTGTTRRY
jgi:dihydrofolate reductase